MTKRHAAKVAVDKAIRARTALGHSEASVQSRGAAMDRARGSVAWAAAERVYSAAVDEWARLRAEVSAADAACLALGIDPETGDPIDAEPTDSTDPEPTGPTGLTSESPAAEPTAEGWDAIEADDSGAWQWHFGWQWVDGARPDPTLAGPGDTDFRRQIGGPPVSEGFSGRAPRRALGGHVASSQARGAEPSAETRWALYRDVRALRAGLVRMGPADTPADVRRALAWRVCELVRGDRSCRVDRGPLLPSPRQMADALTRADKDARAWFPVDRLAAWLGARPPVVVPMPIRACA